MREGHLETGERSLAFQGRWEDLGSGQAWKDLGKPGSPKSFGGLRNLGSSLKVPWMEVRDPKL